jgi:polyketide cyclase/dehydrase/lipid transport protein
MATMTRMKQLTTLLGAAALLSQPTVFAQAPAGITHHYSTALVQIDVARPAKKVWEKIGKFCDIRIWLDVPCKIIEGNEDDVGTVRQLMGSINEVMTSKTTLSYTYAAPDTAASPQKFVHGSLAVSPIGKSSSRISYTLLYDDGLVPNAADRERELASRTALLKRGLERMKELSEQRS